MAKILVIAETNGVNLTVPTCEVCQAASELANLLGESWRILVDHRAADSAGRIAPAVISYSQEGDAFSSPEILAKIAAKMIDTEGVVMAAATTSGKDMMGRLAQLLASPLAQDCTGFEMNSGDILFQRPMYGGKLVASVQLSGCPILVSFRPRSFTTISTSATLVAPSIHIKESILSKTTVKIRPRAGGERPDITEASVVVSGGRGLQGPENWYLLEDLLDSLGPNAALACSRPVSDENWRPHSEHVGQTGRAIAPDLYIAVGISGATQHVAGIAGARCILAINKDPEAPIFKIADYGIVGDLFEVVPALTTAIRAG